MNKIRVLIVDDEYDFATTLAERLELRDFATTVATSGREALHAIQTNSFDVVILDLMMPDMSGLDVLHKVKAFEPTTEVIMLTGHGSTTSGTDGIERGAFDYIMKPIDLAELVTKIHLAYEKRSTNNPSAR